jgi:hypothetical protein
MANPIKVDQPVLPPDLGRAGEWRLARRSFPVVKGHEHNYLELTFVPADGGAPELVGEIHGAAYDREKGTYGHFTIGAGSDLVGIRTKEEHWGFAPTDKNIELARGNFDDVVGRYWKDALNNTGDFNRQPARVYKYDEQNSNNFNHGLIGAIDLEAQSGKWDGNQTDYGANGFGYSPKQWNVRNVFDPKQAVTREDAPPSRSLDSVIRQGLLAGQQTP